jgi:hypothetical protein
MPRKNTLAKSVKRPAASVTHSIDQAFHSLRHPSEPPPVVSARWLAGSIAVAVAAAALCGWFTLCFLFWQGSWQLLFHPVSAVTRTPASAGLAFDPVGFAAADSGAPRLQGWWIPAAPDARFGRYTVLYLHGQDGNLTNTVDALVQLHSVGVNVFAFDYRGYGQSQFTHPSEAHWREDAEWALQYLTETRHIEAGTIILDGNQLGANLALEIAAKRTDLAGVILESPLAAPTDAISNDPRAHLVPAHLLVQDSFDLNASAENLQIPSLWFFSEESHQNSGSHEDERASARVTAPAMRVWLPSKSSGDRQTALGRWLDDLPAKTKIR